MTYATLDHDRAEDRTLPAVVYALYLLGLTHGLTIVIGLIMAYASRDAAGPRMRSHYTFLIRTVWLSIVWFLIGGALVAWGAIFSVVLIGIPALFLGAALCGATWLFFLVRCVVGAVHLARDEAYPRPEALVI